MQRLKNKLRTETMEMIALVFRRWFNAHAPLIYLPERK